MTSESASPVLEETTVHPSAIVLPGVKLGRGVEVGPYCYLEPGVELGDGCRLGPHVHLLGRTILGPRCTVRSGSVLGGEPQDDAYAGERTLVRIGADCQIHEHVTVHRATGDGETVLGDGVRLMAGSHVGHNSRVGDRVILVNGATLGGHSEIGERVIFAGQSGTHQFARVGRLTLVGAFTAVTRDAPPFSIVTGSYPVRWRGPNKVGMRRAGMEGPERDAVRRALHQAFTDSAGPAAVAEQLSGSDCAAVAELAEFILASKRGMCAGPR